MVETVTKMLWDHGGDNEKMLWDHGDSDKDAVGSWWRQ